MCGAVSGAALCGVAPSAPTTRSKRSAAPPSKSSSTPASSSRSDSSLCPSRTVPTGSESARMRCSASRMIEKACGVPSGATSAGSALTSDSTSISSSSNPPLLRLRMRRTGSALAFICSPKPSLAKTAAPPLIWIPPPTPGLSSLLLSNTATSSTPVSSVCSARASARPPIPAPTTATRRGEVGVGLATSEATGERNKMQTVGMFIVQLAGDKRILQRATKRIFGSDNINDESGIECLGKESTRATGPSAATTSDGLLARQRRRVRRPRRRRCQLCPRCRSSPPFSLSRLTDRRVKSGSRMSRLQSCRTSYPRWCVKLAIPGRRPQRVCASLALLGRTTRRHPCRLRTGQSPRSPSFVQSRLRSKRGRGCEQSIRLRW